MDYTSKEFLDKVIADYNGYFKTNFSTNGNEFQNYYKDLSAKVKHKEIDLLIVVGMFLTGFDAPTLNTLFVDKNLKFHGLIQAFSRTNLILNKVKENQIDIVIKEEKLREDSKRFIEKAIGKGYMEYADDELDRIIPPTSRRHGEREKKKESVLDKIRRLVEVFVGI